MSDHLLRYKDYFSDRNLPVDIHEETEQHTIHLHAHEFAELVLVIDGEGIHTTADEEYPVAGGDCFLIPSGFVHGYRSDGGLKLINVLFHPDLLVYPRIGGGRDVPPGFYAMFSLEPEYRKQQNFAGRLHLDGEHLHRCEGLIRELKREKRGKEEGYVFMIMALFMRLVGFLSRSYSGNESVESRSLLRLGESFSYMHSHYAEDIRLAELARMAGMSLSSLNRAFKQACGLAPIEYLVNLRIRESCVFLRDSNDPVAVIAAKVGFADPNYYSRQFKARMGLSPRTYRQAGSRPGYGT